MRSRLALLTLPCVLLLTACDDPLGGGARVLALDGTCTTTFDPPPTIPPPPVFEQSDTGSCEFQNLGTAQFYSVKEINTQAGTQTTSELALTFADGSVLNATGSGQNLPGSPGIINFTATLDFSGGTKRFVRSTGEAQVNGTANMMTRTAAFTIVGEATARR